MIDHPLLGWIFATILLALALLFINASIAGLVTKKPTESSQVHDANLYAQVEDLFTSQTNFIGTVRGMQFVGKRWNRDAVTALAELNYLSRVDVFDNTAAQAAFELLCTRADELGDWMRSEGDPTKPPAAGRAAWDYELSTVRSRPGGYPAYEAASHRGEDLAEAFVEEFQRFQVSCRMSGVTTYPR